MSAAYVVNSDYENYAEGWTTDDAVALGRFLERAEHYIDLMSVNRPVVQPATDTVHKLEMTSIPTGGSFTLTVLGNTTGAIAWNSTFSDVSNRFAALTTLAPVQVVGGPLPYSPIYVGYIGGGQAGQFVPQGTFASSLIGGTLAFTMSAPGGVTNRRYNPGRLSVNELQALKNGTCAQVEYMLNSPPSLFVESQYESVKGPDFTTTGRKSIIGPKAKRELAQGGLLAGLGRSRY